MLNLRRSLHDYISLFVATELERTGAKYLSAKKGNKSTAVIFSHVPLLGTATADKAYCKAAKDLGSKWQHTPDDKIGPVKICSFVVLACDWQVRGHGSPARHRLFRRAAC